ncbi:MAG: molybdopterin-dependent oxidoreductase [Deferrisomatales bacterium]
MTNWDRRSFLKAGAFGTAGLAVDNKARLLTAAEKPWNAKTDRPLRKFRNPAPTVCRVCPAHCGLLAFRDGDRVVQVQGSPGAPNNQGGLCSRAFAGLERLYDAERQLRPLRRAGPRGSGRWEPVSWDEALAQIGARLGTGGGSALHLGQEELLAQELRDVLGWTHLLVDRPFAGRPGSGEAWYGSPVAGFDLARSRTVLLFGVRALDGRFSAPLARDLARAHREGAALHLFDSYAGATGSLAEWHPVVPGTEATVAWGLARLLLRRGAFDAEALAAGVSDTVEALFEAVGAYTPEAVEGATGVPAARLVGLARRFAEARPAVALAPHGSPAAPAAALLNHLAGAVNTRGGVSTARGPYFVQGLAPTAAPEAFLAELAAGRARTDLYWTVDSNPAYDAPQADQVARALADPERVGLLVAMDTHLTETAQLADLFLPLATHFESWGLVEGCLPDGRPYLFLQQPVTRPAGEADKLKRAELDHLSLFEAHPRPLGDARGVSDLLAHLAHGRNPEAMPYPDTRAYLSELLRKSWGPGSLDGLRGRGIWVGEDPKAPNPLAPVALAGAVPAVPGAPDGGLRLVGLEPANLPRGFANTRWGREIQHRCEALLNPATARALGVRAGDRVVLRTAAGEAVVRVRLLQGIHPRAVGLPDGFGHRAGGSVAQAQERAPAPPATRAGLVSRKDFLTSPLGPARREVEPGEPIWWHHEGPGVSLRALFPPRPDAAGGQDWGPVAVEVRKA